MFNLFKKDNKKEININNIDSLIGKINLIDIREPSEYSKGSIESAKNISMNNLLANPEKYLNKEEKYYIMCRSGGRSTKTCSKLKDMGFDVINVSGGIRSYVGNMKK
ncbi:rhodanese-like sulfurtransferase [Gottschalkia purinilytica]|uniref:Rhodanese-like sulfurtransferase n=1 Tax=Gottschalkia purinilytica TaxID=1503 RepID=A0A0L0WC33_GOTPU|nr:rhodanese-like domain-containing protein [Gottschalkia purinilytica]KNF09021.1 rhodanese-like sulfurtransferase [Gottschalkia purinilytica]